VGPGSTETAKAGSDLRDLAGRLQTALALISEKSATSSVVDFSEIKLNQQPSDFGEIRDNRRS
jgi:hypothetical protein